VYTAVRRFTQKHPKIPQNTPKHPQKYSKTLYICTEKTILNKDYLLKYILIMMKMGNIP
jgi:hypothetical protein